MPETSETAAVEKFCGRCGNRLGVFEALGETCNECLSGAAYRAGTAARGGETVHAMKDGEFSLCGVRVSDAGAPFAAGSVYACNRCRRSMLGYR